MKLFEMNWARKWSCGEMLLQTIYYSSWRRYYPYACSPTPYAYILGMLPNGNRLWGRMEMLFLIWHRQRFKAKIHQWETENGPTWNRYSSAPKKFSELLIEVWHGLLRRNTSPQRKKTKKAFVLTSQGFHEIFKSQFGHGLPNHHTRKNLHLMRTEAAMFIVDIVEDVSTKLRTVVYVSKMFHKKGSVYFSQGSINFCWKGVW